MLAYLAKVMIARVEERVPPAAAIPARFGDLDGGPGYCVGGMDQGFLKVEPCLRTVGSSKNRRSR